MVLLAIFGEPPEQDLVRDLKETEDLAVLIGFGVLTCLVAPIAEELFFRGFLFSVLASRLGVAVAARCSRALIFGLIHLPGSPLLGVAVLVAFGALLCVVYWKTGSLIPCMALHALNNAVSFGYTKSLDAAGIVALIAGSVTLVVMIGLALAEPRRSRRRRSPRRALEHAGHPAGGVGRAHPVGAVAVAQDPLDLLERLRRARARARSRSPRPPTSRSRRRPPRHQIVASSPSRPARNEAVGRAGPAPRAPGGVVRAGDRQPVHERGEPAHGAEPRLRVHGAQLHRAELRVRPHVPPQVRVVGRAPRPRR